jgi:phage-related protein
MVYSQTIVTNTVSLKDGITKISQVNVFHIKKDMIFWETPDSKLYVYHIVKSTKLSDLEYIIYCVTDGKVAIFHIKFANNVIILDDLIFYNIDRL